MHKMVRRMELTVTSHKLTDIIKGELEYTIDAITKKLSQRHITGILNTFERTTTILDYGEVYFMISELNTLLRTSNSGLERDFVYEGVPGSFRSSEIVRIDGKDHISQYDLISLLTYRKNNVGRTTTKAYLKIVIEVLGYIQDYPDIKNLKGIYLEKIEDERSKLKGQRIEKYDIRECEFTGKKIENIRDYEFAHLDAVKYNLNKALDIDNGVIIHYEIHKKMTRLGLNTFKSIYVFCKENRYKVDWA